MLTCTHTDTFKDLLPTHTHTVDDVISMSVKHPTKIELFCCTALNELQQIYNMLFLVVTGRVWRFCALQFVNTSFKLGSSSSRPPLCSLLPRTAAVRTGKKRKSSPNEEREQGTDARPISNCWSLQDNAATRRTVVVSWEAGGSCKC